MTDIQGVIEKFHTKSGNGKRGKWTKYSAVINGGWVNFGFDDPGYAEGDEVKVRCEEDEYGLQVKVHKLINKAANGSGNSSSGGTGVGNLGQAWGNANNVAASLLESLVALDAVPVTGSQGKANKAKRFDETLEIFDKLRVKLFKDSQDINRVLDNVADFGAVEDTAPADLPDNNDFEEDSEDDDDDF